MDNETFSAPPPDLLERFLAGAATPGEVRRAQDWIAADPARQACADVLKSLDPVVPSIDDRARVDALWDRLTRRVRAIPPSSAAEAAPRMSTPGVPLRRQGPGATARRMGVIVLAIVAILGVLSSAIGLWSRSRLADSGPLRYATAAGQFAAVVLSDGSRVTLAPQTTLVIPSDFGMRDRSVELSGEAHFSVTPDPRHPLTVRTGAVTTRVLGTTFDVRRYPGDRRGRVIVYSGKVATGARHAFMTLTAGMAGQFTDSAVIGVSDHDSTMYTDWAHGRLVFRDAPVDVVLATLHEWYGYEFRLADSSLVSQHVSAVFLAGEAGEMLSMVQRVLDVTMTRQDSVIILRPVRSGASRGRTGSAERSHTFYAHPAEVGR